MRRIILSCDRCGAEEVTRGRAVSELGIERHHVRAGEETYGPELCLACALLLVAWLREGGANGAVCANKLLAALGEVRG